tara:strand:+ start:184 stop:843 length:660 start_codon:yes stop_codon:yes gene_type:complete
MHKTVQNLINIKNQISDNLNNLNINNQIKIIAVSKTFKLDKILPLIEYGHIDYGENKVQEAVEKWSEIKIKNQKIKLHMIGNLQTNKVKYAVKIFDYIHSVDSEKLAKKIAEEEKKLNKKIKIFIQVNIGNENQKSGVRQDKLDSLVNYCKELNLEVIGLMCIPPIHEQSAFYFKKMSELNNHFSFSEISMGMSSDYLTAVQNSATYIRVGSSIFGERI